MLELLPFEGLQEVSASTSPPTLQRNVTTDLRLSVIGCVQSENI